MIRATRFLAEATLISALVLLSWPTLTASQASADDKKIIIRDVTGRTVTSTRTLETGTLVLRDQWGRNVGFATKNQDGSYTIKSRYGQKVGSVKGRD